MGSNPRELKVSSLIFMSTKNKEGDFNARVSITKARRKIDSFTRSIKVLKTGSFNKSTLKESFDH